MSQNQEGRIQLALRAYEARQFRSLRAAAKLAGGEVAQWGSRAASPKHSPATLQAIASPPIQFTMADRERALEQAIQAFRDGVFPGIRATARAYNVPESTLRDRLRGMSNRGIAHQHQQLLAPKQEEFLAEWILEEAARGFPPSHARAREMANRIIHMNGSEQRVGGSWLRSFLRRNPRVASVVGRRLEAARAEAATIEQIRAFLVLYERTVRLYNIEPSNTYNFDETGIALGVCTNTRVLASSKKKKTYKKTPENREWVSILECISATGRALQPVTIFKGKSLQTTWFPSQSIPDWYYTTSENGWTSNSIGFEWLKRIFLPSTTTPRGEWRLLILDGHGSHVPVNFSLASKMSRVYLLFLPAHSSHILQPADLAPFSVTKSRYRHEIEQLATLDDAAPVKKERFISCYAKARIEGLSERVIRAGWRATGLYPYNPDLVLNSSQLFRPATPPPPPQPATDELQQIFQTPKGHQDCYKAIQLLQQSETISRSTRTLLSKLSKALTQANIRATQYETIYKQLQVEQNIATTKQPKKRIQIDLNERFATLDMVEEAIRKLEAEQANTVAQNAAEAAKIAAEAAAAQTLQSMCFDWPLQPR